MPALLLSLAAVLSWSDLSPARPLALRQSVILGENGPEFPAGSRFSLLGSEPLDLPGAPLVLYKMMQSPCARPSETHALEIVVPDGAAEASSVGVELEPGCRWAVYVEQKDLLEPSLFSAGEN